MNCIIAQHQLSNFLDGELSPERAAEVQQHLDGCESCSRELAAFGKLGELARLQVEPLSTPLAWEMLAKRLDQSSQSTILDPRFPTETSVATKVNARSDGGASGQILHTTKINARSDGGASGYIRYWKVVAAGVVALAASLLVFASLRPLSSDSQSSETQLSKSQPHESQPSKSNVAISTADVPTTMNLQPLLEHFPHDARQALDQLSSQLATSDTTSDTAADVAIEQADATFGRATFVSTAVGRHALPGQAKVTTTRLLSFPFCKCPPGQCTCGPAGCNCVACVCERPDGSTYLVLEHCQSQAVSFGDLPVRVRLINRGMQQVQEVTTGGTQTISFDQANGTVTIVGLRGDAEIDTLIASL